MTEVGSARSGEDLGVFGFAQKTGQLLVPMGIIAGIFGLWLRAELLTVRNDFAVAITTHEKADIATLVSRAEFEAAVKLQEERYRLIQSEMSNQNRMISRNTLLLERISQKLGVQRPAE